MSNTSQIIAAAFIALGIAVGGYLAGQGLVEARTADRTVTVKGLAEREAPANIAIWPIRFVQASNDLSDLVNRLEGDATKVRNFLIKQGFNPDEFSTSPPAIIDKQAQSYGNGNARFRYSATGIITVYTDKVDTVLAANSALAALGKEGVTINADEYQGRAEYIYTGLNDIKPAMVEEATRNAREVAQKFAEDSNSQLGKLKSARQGQFSITNRDSNTAHVKKIRVVSTLEYYLAD